MKNTILILTIFTFLFSCKTKQTIDPDTLPKDISQKPKNGVSQQQDFKILQDLRAEIDEMIVKNPCVSSDKWRISPLGSKACGGPAEYLAYPIEIEDEIIPKIQNYTQLNSDYNKKYDIVSDCMMVQPTSGIKCENGKAVLMNAESQITEQ